MKPINIKVDHIGLIRMYGEQVKSNPSSLSRVPPEKNFFIYVVRSADWLYDVSFSVFFDSDETV